MKQRKLGARGPMVSAIGLGCMGMSTAYGKRDDAESLATLNRALDMGITFIDTADVYGHNEDLIGPVVQKRRKDVFLATKCGLVSDPNAPGGRGLNGRPEHIRAQCDKSLKRLGIDVIDLYYLHRVDPKVPVEESMGAYAELVKAGKILHVGLSEADADDIQRAHGATPIAALQSEYSLWARDPEGPILDTCRRLGIALVSYSPLGRGFLTGTITSGDFDPRDLRHTNPRFMAGNFDRNKSLVEQFAAIAVRKGITPAQLSLAWVLARGEDIIPIPGTKRRSYLEDNAKAADVTLTPRDLADIEALDLSRAVSGQRTSAAFAAASAKR